VIARYALKFLAALLLLMPVSISAHEGEDHSEEPMAAAATSAPSGRLEARTADIELVAGASGDDLTIWIDRWATGEPITNAAVSVTIDGARVIAKPGNGVYTLSAPALDVAGDRKLSFIVSQGGAIDTLSGTLAIAKPADDHAHGLPWRTALIVLLALGVAVAAYVVWRKRARGVGVAVLLIAVLVQTPPIVAHEGEEHADESNATAVAATSTEGGAAATRAADGAINAQKPLQRIIELRTAVTTAGQAAATVNLTGRIIADPRSGGLVQSATGGRIVAAGGGIPLIGQRVRAGQALAYIEPTLEAIDRADIARELTDLDQQIALAANRAARLRRLEGVVPRREIDEAGINLNGLRNRRAALGGARSARETLVAPISGVVVAVPVRVGQVVGAETTLFEIVDPQDLFVEANLFDRRAIGYESRAVGRAADGTTFNLVFAGAGLADRGRAAQGLFRLDGAPAGLRVGEPVTLDVAAGAPVAGVVVPRSAILTGENGLSSVFVKAGAERFVRRSVRIAPVDATRVVLLSGVRVGERVVTAGASLLAQVR
jgi:membrane fusion protein, heavy metal efflux system